MTDVVKSLPIVDNIDRDRIRVQLLYHNVFRQMRKARKEFKLSTNECLVLNGMYLYSFLVKSEFTINGLTLFITYYNKGRIRFYIDSLISKGFVIVHRVQTPIVYYRLSPTGFNAIRTMFDDVDVINRKFCEKYNVSL